MTSVTGGQLLWFRTIYNKTQERLPLLPPPPSSTTSRLPHRRMEVVQEEEETSPPHSNCAVEGRMLAKNHQVHRH
jgi:hypothetical protein